MEFFHEASGRVKNEINVSSDGQIEGSLGRMEKIRITTIENQGQGRSVFGEKLLGVEDSAGMWITERQDALNFRHRMSEPGYASDWHVAGDPTLIIIRQGAIRLTLRDGSYRDFKAGDQFIAADHLEKGVGFDDSVHGHRAEVIGDESLHAVHVKLGSP